MRATLSKRLADQLWKLWYPILTRRTRRAAVVFLNYGYADAGAGNVLALRPEDEADRACIALYHRVASAVDLNGQDVLEVSCGHGGGASYIARYMQPKSVIAMDRNKQAIKLCKARHRVERLTFMEGNALKLPFPDAHFDAVVNIEASHCYPDVPRFFSEVRRVLRPGGDFLFADFRDVDSHLPILRRQLEASGLQLVACADISANVVQGMQLNTEKYEELAHRLMPRFLHKPALSFAGIKGSAIYRALESGETVYLCYHLKAPR